MGCVPYAGNTTTDIRAYAAAGIPKVCSLSLNLFQAFSQQGLRRWTLMQAAMSEEVN